MSTLLYIELALLVLLLVCAPYMLWSDYLCVMALKRQRDGWGLSVLSKLLGTWILMRGYFLDFLVNTVHMSAVLREWPRELTVTKRLRRHIEGNTQHAGFCLGIRTKLLDGFDPAGVHK